MRIIFIVLISILTYSNSTFAQEFLDYKKADFMTHVDTSKFEIIEYRDSIKLIKNDNAVTLMYKFYTDDNCYSSYLNFYSDKCTESYLEDALYDDQNEWVKIDSISYISKSRLAFTLGLGKNRETDCKKMQVIRTPNEKIVLRIIYSIETMKTTEWKKLKKRKHETM